MTEEKILVTCASAWPRREAMGIHFASLVNPISEIGSEDLR